MINQDKDNFKGRLSKQFQQLLDDMANFTDSLEKRRKKLKKKPISNLTEQLKGRLHHFCKMIQLSHDPSIYKETLISLIQYFDLRQVFSCSRKNTTIC